MADYSIDTYLNRGGNYNMYGMTEDMMNNSFGDTIQTIDPYSYEAGTLVDAPLGTGMIPPWVLAAGSIGYLGGKYDVFGKVKDTVGNWIDGFRGGGPTVKHAEKLAMDSGLQMALDDRGYPVIHTEGYGGSGETYVTEGPYAFKNIPPRRGIYDIHGFGPNENTNIEAEDSMTGQDALQAEIAAYERQLEAELAADYQDDWRRGPLQTGTSQSGYDNRTEWQKWTDSFKRDWAVRK